MAASHTPPLSLASATRDTMAHASSAEGRAERGAPSRRRGKKDGRQHGKHTFEQMLESQSIGNTYCPVPLRLFAKLHWNYAVPLTGNQEPFNMIAGTATQFKAFRLNDPNDPDPALGTNSVAYFTNLGNMYLGYRCYGSTVDTLIENNAAGDGFAVACWPTLTVSAPSNQQPSSFASARMMPGARYVIVNTIDHQQVYLRNKFSIEEYIGGSIENNPLYAGEASGSTTGSTSPATILGWNFGVYPLDTVDANANGYCWFKITYDVEFFSPCEVYGFQKAEFETISPDGVITKFAGDIPPLIIPGMPEYITPPSSPKACSEPPSFEEVSIPTAKEMTDSALLSRLKQALSK